MYKVLIVWALSAELNIIKKEIKNLELRNIKVSYFSSWMGNYNMILNLSRFLEQEKGYDFVINIWVCWYKEIKTDFFQVVRILNLSNNDELIVPNIIDFWELNSIASSENIVYDKSEIKSEEYVDMESYGFEKVMDSFFLARLILKIPVDNIWIETKEFDFEKAKKYLKENIDYKTLFEKIEDYLQKNKKEIKDLQKYIDFFKFSFSQSIIFEKLFNKFEVLTDENFEEYFYKYIRSLDKTKNSKNESRKFLDNLEKYLSDK